MPTQPTGADVPKYDTDDAGEIGELAVMYKLKQMHHGVNQLPKSDRGTDVLVSLRRDNKELAQFIGVQVKSGAAKPFKSPYRLKRWGPVAGWWYEEYPDKHFDYWCFHSVPHILVLHHEQEKVSYWVHVSADKVVRTPKGAKILVPKENIVDDSATDKWIAIARAHSVALSFEGSIWRTNPGNPVPSSALLRHALLAPRLIAPHPNQVFHWSFNPYQALALNLCGWRHYIDQWTADNETFPAAEALALHADWGWRLYGAVDDWLHRSQIGALQAVHKDALAPEEIAASAILLACALISVERVDDAKSRLEDALDTDKLTDIDRAWLQSHLAQLCVEQGQGEIGRLLAVEALPSLRGEIRDVTVSPILSSLTNVIFHQTDYKDQDLEGVIRTGDNATSWWRSTGVESSLLRETSRAYLREVPDDDDQLDQEVYFRTYSSATTALLGGDYQDWRRLLKTLSYLMVSWSNTSDLLNERAASVIADLRVAGEDDGTLALLRRLSFSGPLAPLKTAVDQAAEVALTWHTWLPAAHLFSIAGSLLNETKATKILCGLLQIAADESNPLYSAVHRSFLDEQHFVQALGTLANAGGEAALDLLVDHLTALPEQHRKVAESWGNVIVSLPEHIVQKRSEDLSRLGHRVGWDVVRTALARKLMNSETWAQAVVLERIEKFDSDAVTVLAEPFVPANARSSYLLHWQQRVDARAAECTTSTQSIPTIEPAALYVLAAIKTGDFTGWQSVVTFLRSEFVYSSMKTQILRLLLAHQEELPIHIRSEMGTILLAGLPFREYGAHRSFFNLDRHGEDLKPMALVLAYIFGAGSVTEADSRFLELCMGDHNDQRMALRLLRGRDIPSARLGLKSIQAGRDRAARTGARIELILMGLGDPSSTDWMAVLDEVFTGVFGALTITEVVRRGAEIEGLAVDRRAYLTLLTDQESSLATGMR